MSKGLEVTFSGTRIVISIPHSALRAAASYAFERAWGEDSKLRVSNQGVFAKEVYGQLLAEDEEGTTVVHRMLDAAMVEVAEQGCEGLVERKGVDPDA